MIDLVGAFSGDNVMNQIVVPDAGPPLVERVTFLKSDVIDREGNQFFFCDFIGIFIIFLHGRESFLFTAFYDMI